MANRESFNTHEEYLEYHRQYRKKHLETIRTTGRNWMRAHREKLHAQGLTSDGKPRKYPKKV